MTRKTFKILSTVTQYFSGDDLGICSNIHVKELFPEIKSEKMLDGVWLFYRSSINEIFYYTGVTCDLVYMVSCDPNMFVYFYKLE